MHTRRGNGAEKVVEISAQPNHRRKFFGNCVRVFAKNARHGFGAGKCRVAVTFTVIVQQVAHSQPDAVVGVADDGLVNQVGIQRVFAATVAVVAKKSTGFVVHT